MPKLLMDSLSCGALPLSDYTLSNMLFFDVIQRKIRTKRLIVCTMFLLSAPCLAQPIEEVVIVAQYIPDEKLATAEVADLLDSEAMSIAGDSDLGGALKRVPGLSLVGGRFIYVRGLGERYSSTYFNGTPMPSPEPLQRAVPLDMFDTAITKNVLVQKTHSANFGLEFSGGVVDIRSAALPDENFFKLKLSTSYNDISTGKANLTYSGGSRDWLGVDDGGREMPGLIAANLDLYPSIFGNGGLSSPTEDNTRLSFTNNDWDVRASSNPHDYSLSLGGGRRMDLNSRASLGFIAVGSLKNKWRNRLQQSSRYHVDDAAPNIAELKQNLNQFRSEQLYNLDTLINGDPGAPAILSNGQDPRDFGFLLVNDQNRSQRTIRSNMLFAFGVEIDQEHHINRTRMLPRKTTDTITVEAIADYSESQSFARDTRIEWIENEILFHQLSGEHFLNTATINWRAAIVDSLRDTPDAKEYTFIYNDASQFGIQQGNRGSHPARTFTYLEDESQDFGIDIEVPLFRGGVIVPELALKLGASSTQKNRRFESYLFAYDFKQLALNPRDPLYQDITVPLSQLLNSSHCIAGAPNNIATDDCYIATDFDRNTIGDGLNAAGSILLADGFSNNRPDFYTGKAQYDAFYMMLDMQVYDNLRANLGIRNERSLLEVKGRDGELLASASGFLPRLDEVYQLPSMSLTWDFYPNMILRAAYSETVNRPILRELAQVIFFNAEDGRQYAGFAGLQTAEIENYDLRYELYFGDDDYFSLTAFKKRIKNPIEQREVEFAEEQVFTWINAEFAENEGIEFEIRKYFGEYIYVTSNATFIDSAVFDETTELELGISPGSRPLTGLSKELYNLQAVYESDALKASLAYNKRSRRLYAIAAAPGNQGGGNYFVYEEPFQSLDLNLKYSVFGGGGQMSVGFKASNLLDESVERTISNLGGLPYESYEIGQTYSLSIEWQM